MEAPEKIYIPRLISNGKLIHEWNDVPFKKFRFFFDKEIAENIEYTRTDAFIEKACAWLEKHAASYIITTKIHGCNMTGLHVSLNEDFRKAMKG